VWLIHAAPRVLPGRARDRHEDRAKSLLADTTRSSAPTAGASPAEIPAGTRGYGVAWAYAWSSAQTPNRARRADGETRSPAHDSDSSPRLTWIRRPQKQTLSTCIRGGGGAGGEIALPGLRPFEDRHNAVDMSRQPDEPLGRFADKLNLFDFFRGEETRVFIDGYFQFRFVRFFSNGGDK
jgi:hypothetical protein